MSHPLSVAVLVPWATPDYMRGLPLGLRQNLRRINNLEVRFHFHPYQFYAQAAEEPIDVLISLMGETVDQSRIGGALWINADYVHRFHDLDGAGPDYCVAPDDIATGRRGAEHFLERRFRSLAFYDASHNPGEPEPEFARKRREGFQAAARNGGAPVAAMNIRIPLGRDRTKVHAKIAAFLREQTFPLAVMGATDAHAWHIMEACRLHKIAVPSQVAVLGVNNEALWCETTTPTLSSISLPNAEIADEIAKLVKTIQRQGSRERGPIIAVPGGDIHPRGSSSTLAVSDQRVRHALSIIHSHACDQGFDVATLAEKTGVNRRTLELLFRDQLNATPFEAVRNERLEHARKLLETTRMPVMEVAMASALPVDRFSGLFRQHCGLTPIHYRKKHRRQ